jgi:hypothetical protein
LTQAWPAATVSGAMFAARLTLALVAVVFAGCGAQTTAQGPVADAAVKTAEAGSARTESFYRMHFGDQTFTTHIEGLYDFRNRRSETTMHYPEGSDWEMTTRVITIGAVTYPRLPASYGLPKGKRWLRYDTSQLDATIAAAPTVAEASDSAPDDSSSVILEDSAVSVQLVGAPGQGDPGTILEYLRDAGTVTVRGRELVRDAVSTRYHAKLVQQNDETDVDVWIDDAARVRRIMSTSVWGNEKFTIVATTEYFDFGVAVDVAAPPDDEVIDEDEFDAAFDNNEP